MIDKCEIFILELMGWIMQKWQPRRLNPIKFVQMKSHNTVSGRKSTAYCIHFKRLAFTCLIYTNYHHSKEISRLINSARYNRFQLLSLINKDVDHTNWPLCDTAYSSQSEISHNFLSQNYHILEVVHTDQIIQTECKHVPFVWKFTGPLIQTLHFHCHLHQFI